MHDHDRPIRDPQPGEVNPDLVAAYERLRDTIVPSTRIDGWTGARQKRFLEFIADGATVSDACSQVHMSVPSAYAFRRRARGQAFHLGWQAADLLARDRIAGDLLARAVDGQVVTSTRADGSEVTTHRYDNRLALRMLDRLDRYADQSERTAPGHSARMVAAEFDAYLQLVEGEGGPARAGLFMLAREGTGDAVAAELQPVLALARADRLVRCGTTAEVAVADLDPAQRGTWTGEQWARAEAAGLVTLAPPPIEEGASEPLLPLTCSGSDGRRCEAASDGGALPGRRGEASDPAQAHPDINARDLKAVDKLRRLGLPFDDGPPEPDPLLDSPVWWDENERDWRTSFPPPAGFDGYEKEEWGDPDYARELTPDEEVVAMRRLKTTFGIRTFEEAEAERDEWFGAADESGVGPADDATSPSPAGEPGASHPDSFDVTGQGRPCPAPEERTPDAARPAPATISGAGCIPPESQAFGDGGINFNPDDAGVNQWPTPATTSPS